jgi:hypothetical protein
VGPLALIEFGDSAFQFFDATLLRIDALLQQLHLGLQVRRLFPDLPT